MDIDELFEYKHGISIRGKDYGFIGITEDEVDARVNDLIKFVDSFKGSVGGTFGEDMEICIDFPYETLTIEKFTKFEKNFREIYKTFDGHLYLHDINFFTVEESKVLDKLDFEDFEDDHDDSEGEEWKHNNWK